MKELLHTMVATLLFLSTPAYAASSATKTSTLATITRTDLVIATGALVASMTAINIFCNHLIRYKYYKKLASLSDVQKQGYIEGYQSAAKEAAELSPWANKLTGAGYVIGAELILFWIIMYCSLQKNTVQS